jgi:hypothetical protein|tara:strand:- start:247 stop:510 length:264 start_codon:yes stop_codon:yes gene_type:complete
VVALEDFQITALAFPRSPAEEDPLASNVIDLASLQLVLAPGASPPAKADAVKQTTATAVKKASASFLMIVSSLTLVEQLLTTLSARG